MPLFEHKKEAIRHATMSARLYGKVIGVEKTEDYLWEASEAAATPFAVFIAYPPIEPELISIKKKRS